jgi:hypothetical protein
MPLASTSTVIGAGAATTAALIPGTPEAAIAMPGC